MVLRLGMIMEEIAKRLSKGALPLSSSHSSIKDSPVLVSGLLCIEYVVNIM